MRRTQTTNNGFPLNMNTERRALRDLTQHPGYNTRSKQRDAQIRKSDDAHIRKSNDAQIWKSDEAMEWEETPEDFDSTTNPDLCGEYCKEIFSNEREREVKWVIKHSFSNPKEVKMRSTCVDWLLELCFSWNLATDTVFVAVLYFDKVLCRTGWDIDQMQLLAGTCLLLAAKMEEVLMIPLDDIVEVVPNIDREMVKVVESKVLSILDYEMVTPHLMLFMRRYNTTSMGCAEQSSPKSHHISKYLASLTLRYQYYCCFAPSILAAAICYLSRRLVGIDLDKAWSTTQVYYSGYTFDTIKTAVYFVSNVLCNVNRFVRVNGSPNLGVNNKAATAYFFFSSPKFGKVSLDPCMHATWVTEYSLKNMIRLEL